MNLPRSWCFELPIFDGDSLNSGLQITPQGKIAMREGAATIRQSIQLLLATTPGERVMRPEYGCKLHRLVFAANDDTTAGLAIHYVTQALEQWEPRIDILSVDAFPAEEDHTHLKIEVEYRIKASYDIEKLTYRLDLQVREH